MAISEGDKLTCLEGSRGRSPFSSVASNPCESSSFHLRGVRESRQKHQDRHSSSEIADRNLDANRCSSTLADRSRDGAQRRATLFSSLRSHTHRFGPRSQLARTSHWFAVTKRRRPPAGQSQNANHYKGGESMSCGRSKASAANEFIHIWRKLS